MASSRPYISAESQAPSLDDIARIGEAELNRLMPALGRFIGHLPVRVQDFAEEDVLQELGLESPFDLMGLYVGQGLAGEEMAPSGSLPAFIFLYRRPLLDYWCESGEPLRHIVRHVLIHEIGHHFGLSDETMAAIEARED